MFDRPLSSPCSILLVGCGGHACSCVDVIESVGFRIVGLVGRVNDLTEKVLSYSVLGSDDDLPALMNIAKAALVSVGQIDTPTVRIRLFERLREIGFELPSIASPHAYVSSNAKIGAGSIVMHGAIVNAGAVIGENCIINSRALIEHGVRVGNHCHIATGAVLNGDVEVGEGSFVGSAAVVREGVVLGRQCVIGMGLSIRHNQPDGARVVENC